MENSKMGFILFAGELINLPEFFRSDLPLYGCLQLHSFSPISILNRFIMYFVLPTSLQFVSVSKEMCTCTFVGFEGPCNVVHPTRDAGIADMDSRATRLDLHPF